MKTSMKEMIKKVSSNKKAVIAIKMGSAALVAVFAAVAYTTGVFASGPDFSSVANPIVTLLNSLIRPILLIVGAGGAIFCIMLGVKYAMAEEPQEREKRKQSLKTAIIGYLLIFILVVALRLSIDPLTKWMESSSKTTSATSAPSVNSTQE